MFSALATATAASMTTQGQMLAQGTTCMDRMLAQGRSGARMMRTTTKMAKTKAQEATRRMARTTTKTLSALITPQPHSFPRMPAAHRSSQVFEDFIRVATDAEASKRELVVRRLERLTVKSTSKSCSESKSKKTTADTISSLIGASNSFGDFNELPPPSHLDADPSAYWSSMLDLPHVPVALATDAPTDSDIIPAFFSNSLYEPFASSTSIDSLGDSRDGPSEEEALVTPTEDVVLTYVHLFKLSCLRRLTTNPSPCASVDSVMDVIDSLLATVRRTSYQSYYSLTMTASSSMASEDSVIDHIQDHTDTIADEDNVCEEQGSLNVLSSL
jgi:hypothetical protein